MCSLATCFQDVFNRCFLAQKIGGCLKRSRDLDHLVDQIGFGMLWGKIILLKKVQYSMAIWCTDIRSYQTCLNQAFPPSWICEAYHHSRSLTTCWVLLWTCSAAADREPETNENLVHAASEAALVCQPGELAVSPFVDYWQFKLEVI